MCWTRSSASSFVTRNGEGSDAVSIEPLVASLVRRVFFMRTGNPLRSKTPLEYQPACKPGSVRHRPLARTIRDGHSSGTMFAHGLEQPTRTAGLTSPRGVIACANSPLRRPYSVLLPVGFTMPVPLPEPRCALTAPFHPYFLRGGSGSFSVALSLGLPPPDVIRHRMSREPGLSSPAAFRHLPERPSGRLTGYAWSICDGSVKSRSQRTRG